MIALVRIALQPAVYVRRARAADPDRRPAGRAAHADRHLPRHPHSGDRRGLAVHRPAAGPDGGPHHHAVPARADHHGQRHRAHRGELLQRRRHRQDLLPAECRHPHRQRAGHRDLADHAAADAARDHAAADPQLQRLDRADHPARAVGRRACRAERSPTSASTSCARRWSRCRARRSRFRSAASSARSRSTSIRRRCRRAACRARTSPTRSPRRT